MKANTSEKYKHIDYHARLDRRDLLGGCGASSPIGLVDVQRIVANWPEYQNYQNQLLVDERSITNGRGNQAQKMRATVAMQQKYSKITEQLTQQIRNAASKIAQDKRLQLVLTREGVGYGGVDITNDVEKSLNITEKATPTPGTLMLGTLRDLAGRVGGSVVGDGGLEIARIAAVEEAGPDALTFATDERYLAAALKSRAAAVLVDASLPHEPGVKPLLVVENARHALAQLLAALRPSRAARAVRPRDRVDRAGRPLAADAYVARARLRRAPRAHRQRQRHRRGCVRRRRRHDRRIRVAASACAP